MQTGHFFPVIYTKSSLNILAKFNEARGREEAALARNGLCSGVIIERKKKLCSQTSWIPAIPCFPGVPCGGKNISILHVS